MEMNSQTISANGERVISLNGKDPGPNGGLQTSHLQFATNEELGDGLKAGFTVGAFFQPDNRDLGRLPATPFYHTMPTSTCRAILEKLNWADRSIRFTFPCCCSIPSRTHSVTAPSSRKLTMHSRPVMC